MGNEILSLSTIVDKDTIGIESKKHPNGKSYDFVSKDDLGPYEHQLLVTKYEEASALLTSTTKLTPAQERKLLKAFGDVVTILLPRLEPAVLAELTIGQRSKIVKAWADRNGGGEETGPLDSPTTARSSRRSAGSSAATRKGGSTRQRGSSARTKRR